KIEHLYNIGAFRTVSKYLRQISSNSEDISRFLNDLEKTKTIKNEILLTTHQRAIFTNHDSNSTIIFDEDPIQNLFPISQMKVSDLVFAFTKLQDNELNKIFFFTFKNILLNSPFVIFQK